MEDSLKLSPFFTIGGFVYLIGFFFLPFLCEDDTTILCALKSVKDMPAHFWCSIQMSNGVVEAPGQTLALAVENGTAVAIPILVSNESITRMS
jgi:hypothetical protein